MYIVKHPEEGADNLKDSRLDPRIIQAIIEHHERLDGSGYPFGLKAGQISRPGRIIAVADVAEAIISHRPYREAFAPEVAYKYLLENKGKLFDSKIAETCVELLKSGFVFENDYNDKP